MISVTGEYRSKVMATPNTEQIGWQIPWPSATALTAPREGVGEPGVVKSENAVGRPDGGPRGSTSRTSSVNPNRMGYPRNRPTGTAALADRPKRIPSATTPGRRSSSGHPLGGTVAGTGNV